MSERDDLPALPQPRFSCVDISGLPDDAFDAEQMYAFRAEGVAQRDEQIAEWKREVERIRDQRDALRAELAMVQTQLNERLFEAAKEHRAEVEALRAKRVPLTNEQIHKIARDECYDGGYTHPAVLFARAIERAHGIDAARAEAKPADTHVTEHHVKALKQQMRADPQYALRFLVEAGIANPDGTLTEHYRAEAKPEVEG